MEMSLPKRLTADTANMFGINFQTAPKSKLLQLERGGSPGERNKICPGGSKLVRICEAITLQLTPKTPSYSYSAAGAWRRSCVLGWFIQLPAWVLHPWYLRRSCHWHMASSSQCKRDKDVLERVQ